MAQHVMLALQAAVYTGVYNHVFGFQVLWHFSKPVLHVVKEAPGSPGELADVLDMAPSDLALRIIPAAIPKLTEDKSRDGLEALAHSVGYGLQQMMLDYGHHVVAKYLYGGNLPQ